jgi:DNA polymerase sigma
MIKVAKVLKSAGMKRVEAILTARVPIVKFVDPQTAINCDINSNHVLGIHNSEMIRCYTLIDDRVKPFIYNLKALVKAHGINDSSKAYLSSYSYVLMAIGFLQAQASLLQYLDTSIYISTLLEAL